MITNIHSFRHFLKIVRYVNHNKNISGESVAKNPKKIVSVSNITSNYQNKQDKIVSTQHIKTINGVNIVGPGDVSLYDGLKIIGVDSTLDSSSINPVQNKVVSNKFKTLEEHIKEQDSSITNYIKKQDASIEEYFKEQDSSIEAYIKNQDSSITDAITWENISKQ